MEANGDSRAYKILPAGHVRELRAVSAFYCKLDVVWCCVLFFLRVFFVHWLSVPFPPPWDYRPFSAPETMRFQAVRFFFAIWSSLRAMRPLPSFVPDGSSCWQLQVYFYCRWCWSLRGDRFGRASCMLNWCTLDSNGRSCGSQVQTLLPTLGVCGVIFS